MTKGCQGYPQIGCGKAVSYHFLGWDLCGDCARAYEAESAPPTQDVAIAGLRDQLATCHEAIGAALALLRQGSTNAAILVLDEALKGKTMHTPPSDPIDIPDEAPPITPGGEDPGEFQP